MEALPIRVSELSIAGTEYAKIQNKIQTAESLAERLTECLAIVRHELLAELPLPRLAALFAEFQTDSPRNPLDKNEPAGLTLSPGRGATLGIELSSGRELVARRFRRGGFVRHFFQDLFFLSPAETLSATRPVAELRILSILRAGDLSVPLPIACYATRVGRWGYRGMIVTERVPETTNLLSLLRLSAGGPSKEQLNAILEQVGVQAGVTVSLGICHRDLHLGNVLVSHSGEVTLIDFDKAALLVRPAEREAADRFLQNRFERSARKHRLDWTIAPFLSGYRKGRASRGELWQK